MSKKESEIKISLSTFDTKDYNYQNIQYIMDKSINDVAQNLYYVMLSHAVCKALQSGFAKGSLKHKLIEPKTLEDYAINLNSIKQACDKLDIGFNFANKIKIKKLNETSKLREEYSQMLKQAESFINSASELARIKEIRNTRDYIKQVNIFYNRMLTNLIIMAAIADYPSLTIEKFGEGYKKIFEDLAEYFKTNVEIAKTVISHEREVRKLTNKYEKEMAMIDAKSRAIKSPPNETENKRLNLIKKANAFYDEFCLDFLRDLENQVPYSVKDMYETFINEKFANFQNKFNMPLSNEASEGMATEAIYQINLMIDHIGKIKESSYVTWGK